MNLLDSRILAYFEKLVNGWGEPRHDRHVRIQAVFDRRDKITAGDIYDLVDGVQVIREERTRFITANAEVAAINVKQQEEIERLTCERDEAQERFEDMRDVVYDEANVERERLRAITADVLTILDSHDQYDRGDAYRCLQDIRIALRGGVETTQESK